MMVDLRVEESGRCDGAPIWFEPEVASTHAYVHSLWTRDESYELRAWFDSAHDAVSSMAGVFEPGMVHALRSRKWQNVNIVTMGTPVFTGNPNAPMVPSALHHTDMYVLDLLRTWRLAIRASEKGVPRAYHNELILAGLPLESIVAAWRERLPLEYAVAMGGVE